MSRVDMYGGKRPKSEVQYSPASNDEYKCGGCRHFMAPSSCVLVMGNISPEGWCKLFYARGKK